MSDVPVFRCETQQRCVYYTTKKKDHFWSAASVEWPPLRGGLVRLRVNTGYGMLHTRAQSK